MSVVKNEVILASQCGATLGKYILTVEKNPVDLKYTEKVSSGTLRTSSPIDLYSIKPTRVESLRLVESANGVRSVEFNGDAELRLPLANASEITAIIPEPSAKSVKEAIRKAGSGEKVIFTDYIKLTKEIVALNTENRLLLEAFINEQMKFISTFTNANLAEQEACKKAMMDEGMDVSNLF